MSKSLDCTELAKAARDLLAACDMEDHNEAIFSGKWKKGSKAWNGEFVRKRRSDAMARVRALVPPDDWAEDPWNGLDDGLNHHNRQG